MVSRADLFPCPASNLRGGLTDKMTSFFERHQKKRLDRISNSFIELKSVLETEKSTLIGLLNNHRSHFNPVLCLLFCMCIRSAQCGVKRCTDIAEAAETVKNSHTQWKNKFSLLSPELQNAYTLRYEDV